MRALQYAFEEAIASVWRERRSSALSTATIAVALFVLGGFLLVTSNLKRLTEEWSRTAEISVYLDDEATPADRGDVERLLAPGGPVASFEYVSKEDAVQRFKETFKDLSGAMDGLERNPLPASYEARIAASSEAQGHVDDLIQKLRESEGVVDVRFDREWLDRLVSAIGLLQGVGLVLGAILVLAAALTVANVVRLTLFARRDELEIMQLVGAPRAFIRGPFVMEGLFQGGFGALAALALLAALFLALNASYLAPLSAAANLPAFRFLPIGSCLGLLAGGMAVGCLGGTVAAAGRT
jgi:cell division transport system permease protein